MRIDQEAAKEPRVACIRLTGGSSDDAVWVLEEGVGGTFLTIGSDPECEWQIRAAGVPAHAVSVLLIGGTVYVRSGPQRSARMNGRLLSQDWQSVETDARLDVGMASLEIKLNRDALLPSLKDLPTPQLAEPVRASKSGQQRAPFEPERSGMRRAHVRPVDAPTSRRSSPGKSGSGLGWLYFAGAVALCGAYAFFLTLLD